MKEITEMNSYSRNRKICIANIRINAFATIVVLTLLVASAFVAGAQGIWIGNVYIPPCSIERPGDAGVRMHTNYQILLGPLQGFMGGLGGVGHFSQGAFTPANLRQIYDLPSTGGSQIIAVVDAYDDPNALNDFNFFATTFGLATESSTNVTASTNKVFQVLYASGTQPPVDNGVNNGSVPGGWEVEESLDIEWAHAMAPNAKIILVECANNNTQSLLNGVAAATGYSDGNGATVKEISSSWGGSEFNGETSFDSYFSSTDAVFFCSAGDDAAPADWPSACPFVVSAGGTTVNVNGSNVLLSETAWNSGGGGPSKYEARPFFQNVIASIVIAARGTPDISYDANPNTGVYVYDTYPYEGGVFDFVEIGGTSLSSPALAGIANTAATAENGFPAGSQALLANIYTNYANFYTGSPGDVFRDITSGNNGYAAMVGWDFVTGVGSCLGCGTLARRPQIRNQ
jgi:subtilase family serine protease